MVRREGSERVAYMRLSGGFKPDVFGGVGEGVKACFSKLNDPGNRF